MRKTVGVPFLLPLFAIGLAGAIPLPLIGSVLTVYLGESDFKELLVLFSLLHLPYSVKILWGPLVDRLDHSKQAVLFVLMGLGVSLAWLGVSLHFHSMVQAAIASGVTALLSGLFYMVGIRYEVKSAENLGRGVCSSSVVFGYRIGLLTAGAGTLIISYYFSWLIAYVAMAALLSLSACLIALFPEPVTQDSEKAHQSISWKKSLLMPLKEMWSRPLALFIFTFLLLYRMSDDLAEAVLRPFYLELGFSKLDIAEVCKGLGMAATLTGVAMAGLLLDRWNPRKTYVLAAVCHAAGFCLHALMGAGTLSWSLFSTAVVWDHLTGGMAITCVIAYLWKQCHPRYAAQQYALLSSFLSCKRSLFAAAGAEMALWITWPVFFVSLSIFSLIGACAAFYCIDEKEESMSPVAPLTPG